MSDNQGAYQADFIEKDITGLTNAGDEPLSTWTDDSGIDRIDGVTVVDQEDETLHLSPDLANDRLDVVNIADGSDIASTTDIGRVTLKIEGRN